MKSAANKVRKHPIYLFETLHLIFLEIQNHQHLLYEDFSNYKPLLFVGMKTYHANLAVNQILKNERFTLLSHFFDPSPSWGIGNILRTIRNR